MATLTIRDVPDELLDRLRERAEADRRSLSKEALYLLEVAVEARGGTRVIADEGADPGLLAAMRQQRERLTLRLTDASLREARDEGRP